MVGYLGRTPGLATGASLLPVHGFGTLCQRNSVSRTLNLLHFGGCWKPICLSVTQAHRRIVTSVLIAPWKYYTITPTTTCHVCLIILGLYCVNVFHLHIADEFNSLHSTHACLTGPSCDDAFLIGSTCYKIQKEKVRWFTAVNRCLSNNATLAVFDDSVRRSIPSSLLSDKTWIGLVKSWWTWTGLGWQMLY